MNDRLTTGRPIKVILQFALPLYIGQLFQMLYGVIDTRIIGKALGDISLAGVAATTSLSDLLIEFLNGLICGFGIIMATHYGAKENDELKKSIGHALVLSAICTVLVTVLCLVALPYILTFMNVDSKLYDEAYKYIFVIICGLLATSFYNYVATVLRSIGDSFTPLLFLVISNVLNIAMDYLLVMGLGAGVRGAALATVTVQIISGVLCYLYMRKKYPWLKLSKNDFAFDKKLLREMIPQGLSMGFMISFVTIGSLVLQKSINGLGNEFIVAHTGARKITLMFLIPFFALGSTFATYCGQNIGAKEYGRIKTGIRDTILACVGWCAVAILFCYTLSGPFVKWITATDNNVIIDNAVKYLHINSVCFIFPAVICILRNGIQGLGDTKTPLVSSVIELIGKVLVAFLLVPYLEYMGVIISEPIVWAVMVIPLIVGYRLRVKKWR